MLNREKEIDRERWQKTRNSFGVEIEMRERGGKKMKRINYLINSILVLVLEGWQNIKQKIFRYNWDIYYIYIYIYIFNKID